MRVLGNAGGRVVARITQVDPTGTSGASGTERVIALSNNFVLGSEDLVKLEARGGDGRRAAPELCPGEGLREVRLYRLRPTKLLECDRNEDYAGMLVAPDASGASGRERAEAEAEAEARADAEAEVRADVDAEMDWDRCVASSDDDHDGSYADTFRRILGTAVESGGNDGEGGSTGPPTQAMETGSEEGAALASFVDSDDDEPAPGGAPTARRRAASRKRRRLASSVGRVGR